MMYGDAPGASGAPPAADRNRNVDYFPSSFVDVVLGGLFGIRGSPTGAYLIVNPLYNGTFAVDNLLYHGREVGVSRGSYGCADLCVYVDGAQVAAGAAPLNVSLN